MGVVFAAYDPQLDRKVALKLLRTGLNLSSKEARTRLKREAQAIAQLSHPNVVAVYDVGATEAGDLYIAMEFVEGDTLTSWLKKWPRTWREILDVFLQAGRGLGAAHATGLLHRDFKPDNVLVGGDGRVRVTDFGLARSVLGPDEGTRPRADMTALQIDLTATGTVLGTPRYMAPEQLTSADIDARADQFSFCIALFEALYGTHPLADGTSIKMLENNVAASPPPEGTKVPAATGRVVSRGLEKDPKKRYPNMAQLIAELSPRPERSKLRLVALALIPLLVLGGSAAAWLMRERPLPVLSVEDNATKELILRLNKSEAQRKALVEQIKHDRTIHAEVLEQLDQKNQEIDTLVKEVAIIKSQGNQNPVVKSLAKPQPVTPAREALVASTVDAAEPSLEGCFNEWQEREPNLSAEMMVRLSVSPDGIGHSASASGPDSPSLKLCVQGAIASLHFPEGSEQLDLDVRLGWAAGSLSHSARVVGHHDAPAGGVQLD
jgi:serine/threonine protein kinase